MSPIRRQRRRRSPDDRDPRSGERGQATVELALVLPLLVVLAVVVVHVGLVVRDQVLVTHAAREGARAAAVDPEPGAARAAVLASSALEASRLRVTTAGRGAEGSLVTVTVRYRSTPSLPLVGRFVGPVELEAAATMRVE